MLTEVKCKNATSEGLKIRKLADTEGLYLWVYADGRKYWRLRDFDWCDGLTDYIDIYF